MSFLFQNTTLVFLIRHFDLWFQFKMHWFQIKPMQWNILIIYHYYKSIYRLYRVRCHYKIVAPNTAAANVSGSPFKLKVTKCQKRSLRTIMSFFYIELKKKCLRIERLHKWNSPLECNLTLGHSEAEVIWLYTWSRTRLLKHYTLNVPI